MKRFFAVLTAGMILFSFAACGSNDSTEQTATIDTLSSTSADEPPVTTTTAATTTATTTTTAETAEEPDLSALELIGYSIDEEGDIWINEDPWQECEDFDLFREYFFGTWDKTEADFGDRSPFYVIDDSEKAFLMNDVNWRFTGFYKISENVLAFEINGQAGLELFWLDINDPDRMYAQWLLVDLNGLFYAGNDKEFETPVLTKTDTPPNEPAENFLSIYKLYEMSRDYGMDFELLVDMKREVNIRYEGEEITIPLLHDDWYQFYPVYLVSEAPDRLELKTRVGNLLFENLEIDVRYTLEKVGGEWVRTVEFDDEDFSALELIGYQIDDGEICVDLDSWQECEDFDLFREYFFGTWESDEGVYGHSLFVVDDSEKAFLMNEASFRFTGFYRVSENVLAFEINGNAEAALFWLEIGDPDRMYMEYAGGYSKNKLLLHEFQRENDHKIPVLTKTDTPPNEPAENFLSIYKLYEMSRDYGIDLELLMNMEREAEIEYEGKEMTARLLHDDWYQFFPVYLVSEAPEKLELKTRVGNLLFENLEIGVRYTLEKVGGEWVRTVEYDDEALTALSVIRYQIGDRWIVRFDADRWEYSEDYDLFRKYFFGTWENTDDVMGYSPFVIDDSEKSTIQTPWSFGGFYEIDENVLAFTMWASAGGRLCWLDRNEPGRMYEVDCMAMQIHQYAWFNHGIAVLTKTDAPPNEPENNYLSDIRLRELSRKYGIDILEMIYIHCETDREEDGKKTTVHMDADIYPKYLISEAPEKVVLKTRVGNPYEKVAIDAWCTFEKVDGEWVRTVEFDGDVRLR